MARGGWRLRQVADCMKRFRCSARDIQSSSTVRYNFYPPVFPLRCIC
ncbi:unnamed protein product [Tetraodon nigroviridis]|uniref:(spotted green pufferfish) hypothetical protein n=1 Tax=Tetraodon nigroviridis TaxID=99883 RepID=Q4S9U1_TETNG|nr:unnamed protein product [Tetraodon nigroviridis]CAG02591.1 unnamed protein product [Tetraodon nigroviridis]